jgi:acyl-CoA dehydrogenase
MEAATREQVEAALQQGEDVPFSLELSDDQKNIRDWVHGFAESTVRPAAAEWDEREETPWPVIQEAAKIGLYGFEGIAQLWADPSGLTLPIANEELFWGDAGIGMAIMGTTLAVAGIFSASTSSSSASGCRSASARSRTPRSAPSACLSPTPARTSRRCAPAPSTTKRRTSGC